MNKKKKIGSKMKKPNPQTTTGMNLIFGPQITSRVREGRTWRVGVGGLHPYIASMSCLPIEIW